MLNDFDGFWGFGEPGVEVLQNANHNIFFACPFANKQMAWKSLVCNTFITMVKPAQLGNCNYPTGALHLSWKRGLLIQSQVRAGLMITIECSIGRGPHGGDRESLEFNTTELLADRHGGQHRQTLTADGYVSELGLASRKHGPS